MKDTTKKLLMIYVITVIVKAILSYFIPAPSEFSDGYIFAKMARSLFFDGNFIVHGVSTHQYPPLYPIILSVSYIFRNMEVVYFFMKFINVIISSLIILPAWLLAREFLNEKESILVTILIAIIPSNFAFSSYILAENLFYPVALFAIYFIYKSFTEKSYKWDIAAGIFIGLSYLTKTIGIVFLAIIAVLALIKIIKEKGFEQIKKKIILYIVALAIMSPWLIRNLLFFGFSINSILGGYENEVSTGIKSYYPISIFAWFLLYLGFLILSTGIIFAITSLNNDKRDKKLNTFFTTSIVSIIFFILIASHHNTISSIPVFTKYITGRAFGRHIDVLLPLIFILGFIGFKNYESNKKIKYPLLIAIILAFSSILSLSKLLPPNSISLSHIGLINIGLNYLIGNLSVLIILLLFLASFLFILMLNKKNKLRLNKIFPYLIIFFLLISLLSYSMAYYNSTKYWYKGEQMQLGLWFNSYDRKISTIMFDERDEGRISKLDQSSLYQLLGNGDQPITIMGFWMNDDIIIGDVSNSSNVDYVISKHELDLPLIKRTENFFVYKTE